MIRAAVARDAQFVIATHSPILMACPDARLLHLDGEEARPARWEELEHVRLTRDFLLNPAAFLRHL